VVGCGGFAAERPADIIYSYQSIAGHALNSNGAMLQALHSAANADSVVLVAEERG